MRPGRDMSKAMDPADADGENLGIVKFGPQGAPQLVDDHGSADRRRRPPRLGAPGLRASSRRTRPLHAIGTRGFPWIEIDFPEDYQRAVREVLPPIDSDHAAPAPPSPAIRPVLRPIAHRPAAAIAAAALR